MAADATRPQPPESEAAPRDPVVDRLGDHPLADEPASDGGAARLVDAFGRRATGHDGIVRPAP
jgi:hypothetical protein